jgi:hypothetical protein
MKRRIIFGGILLTMSALGCATNNPPAPPPLEIAPQSVPDAEPTPVPLKGADLLAQQPPEVQAAVKQHQQDGAAWQVLTTDRSQLYPYGEGPEPVVDCEPLRSTDLQLQAGETITDVVSGTENQMVDVAGGIDRQVGLDAGDLRFDRDMRHRSHLPRHLQHRHRRNAGRRRQRLHPVLRPSGQPLYAHLRYRAPDERD